MPTGYTACIDGRDASFEEYAIGCAHAFGALLQRRDSSPSATLPKKIIPSDYHEKRLTEARVELARLQSMTPDECARAAAADYEAAAKSHVESVARDTELRARYTRMRVKVEAWTPPTKDHVGLKEFMLSQLSVGHPYEAGWLDRYAPKKRSAKEWLAENIARAERDIEYHAKGVREDQERCAEATRWCAALAKSLGVEQKGTERR